MEGKVGLGAAFDGRSGFLVVPDSPRLGLKQFTVEGWVRIHPEAQGTQWLVSKNESADGMPGFDLSVTDGRLRARVFDGGDGQVAATSARALVEPGTWRHVAMTWDGTTLGTYVDGKSFDLSAGEPAPVKANEAPGAAAVVADKRLGPSGLYLARRSAGGARLAEAPEEFHLRGSLDGWRVYCRALTPAGVRAVAQAQGKLPRALRQVMIEDIRFDELLSPSDPGVPWEWVQREGRAGHTLGAPASGSVHAAVDLISPVTQHLGCQPGAVVEAVGKNLVSLGGGEEAWRLFDWTRRVEGGQAPARAERLRWFLGACPTAAGADQAQSLLAEALLDANAPPDPSPAPVRARRVGGDTSIREWLVVGSWQNDPATRSGFTQLLEPEQRPMDLRAKYTIWPGEAGQARWRVIRASGSRVDLRAEASSHQQAVMLAACFVYTPQPRRVQFEFGCDDSMDVRVNRRLVHRIAGRYRLVPREASVEVLLPVGWSEIMLKVAQGREGAFGFTFEACDPVTGGPVEDVTFSTSPPLGLP